MGGRLGKVDLTLLSRTTEEIYSLKELRARLDLGRRLNIKYGVDLTAPFLHIGHAVNLWMMRHLQECGHKVIFLIGDFTTSIGDPTGRSRRRKLISPEQIEANAKELIEQVTTVLLADGEVFEVRRNSEWYDTMPLRDLMSLLSMVTHGRLVQREMFQERLKAGREIHMHELLYPVLQGYDSVMLRSDLTIVGSDQLFNELMGRFYQERFGQRAQVVITTKITPGTDGVQKQSKSLGNYIALTDTPRDKFGKVMSIPDELIVPYLEVYTLVPREKLRQIERSLAEGALSPMAAKKYLAGSVVERYHGREVAEAEEKWFTDAFSDRVQPKDVPVLKVPGDIGVVDLLERCLTDKSRSAIRRLLAQDAVRLNNVKLKLTKGPLGLKNGDTLKVGKTRWFRIRIT